MKRIFMLALLGFAIFSLGCGGSQATAEVRHISMDEAKQMMEKESDFIIVDVRTQKEFAEGHIPHAICIPNETIDKTPPSELADKDQTIMVYCRSGRRSKEAAQKLADMGYKNVIEFGGIIDWHDEVVRD